MTVTPKTFLDLQTDLVRRVRNSTGDTSVVEEAKKFLNLALKDMHVGTREKFHWAERQALLVTQPQFEEGTVSVTQGSSTVIGVGTTWNTANVIGNNNVRIGGKIKFANSVNVYTVATVASDTSLTITPIFTDDTITATGYLYFEDEASLADDFARPIDLQMFDNNREIRLISRTDFRARFPRNAITGKPRVATIEDKPFESSADPVRKIVFHKPPDRILQIPYGYITENLAVSATGSPLTEMIDDTDEPIVPLIYRHAITFHALETWYRDRTDDDRALQAASAYTDLMIRIQADQEHGAVRASIRPDVSGYVSRAHSPYDRGSTRFTLGDRFDNLEDRRR